MRAAVVAIALAALPGLPALSVQAPPLPAWAAGPEYVPDRSAVAPYEMPPRPEDLDQLEIRELEARLGAIEARLDRIDAMRRQRQQPASGQERAR